MRVAIIGGGFTGLTAAYELAKGGHRVTVFEKDKTLGGLANGFKRPNWDWNLEYAYHHLFANDWAILSLVKELGLEDKLLLTRPITANYIQGNIIQLDSPSHLLSFPYLSVVDKLRTAALLAFCKINPIWQPLESITAKQLFEGVGGRAAWHALWEPLMVGKFAEFADTIASSWLWARIKKRTPSLYYIKGGFHMVVETLERTIKRHGGIIQTGIMVSSITPSNSKKICFCVSGRKSNNKSFSSPPFGAVLLTIPTPVAAKLLSNSSFVIRHYPSPTYTRRR